MNRIRKARIHVRIEPSVSLLALVVSLTFAPPASEAEIPEEELEFLQLLSPDATRFFPIEKPVTPAAARLVETACSQSLSPGRPVKGYAGITHYPHEMTLEWKGKIGQYDASLWVVVDRKYWSIKTVTVTQPEELWAASANFLAQFTSMRLSRESSRPLSELLATPPRQLDPDSAATFLEREHDLMSRMTKPEKAIQKKLSSREGSIVEHVQAMLEVATEYSGLVRSAPAPKINRQDLEFLGSKGPKMIPDLEELVRASQGDDWDEIQAAYDKVAQSCDSCHASYLPRMSRLRKAEGGLYPGHFVVGHDLQRDDEAGVVGQDLANTVKAVLLLGRELWP